MKKIQSEIYPDVTIQIPEPVEYKEHTVCRVCGSVELIEYINLGMLPLSNNLCESTTENPARYPLKVLLCDDCGLSQLSIVINPEALFGHYVYRSSINKGYVDHCRKMAKDLRGQYGLTQDSFMVDIAGNDGALLLEFRDEIGLKILNIDPAVNLAAICEATGIPTLTFFWSELTAGRVMNSFGKADLITGTNVFAHVDNVEDFLKGVKLLLKPSGVCILEFPYLVDFIERNEFDTIYFEHLSYFGIRPLAIICDKVGLTVMKVEKEDIHGGSVRVHIGNGEPDESIHSFISKEWLSLERYLLFSKISNAAIRNFRENIMNLSKVFKVAGFAASAKGNTLLNCAGITVGSMKYIVDETPEKIGKYSPGTFIPIVAMRDMMANPPDYLVILSWNFADEIVIKCRAAGYVGRFIIPIPQFKIID